jgi:hypothetical protein
MVRVPFEDWRKNADVPIRTIQTKVREIHDRQLFGTHVFLSDKRNQEEKMRRQLIEALTYPRLLVLKIIEDRDCPHESLFEALDERCFQCDINKECHWVSCLNDFGDFEDKPAYTINASLRYGIKLVESLHSELKHDETLCTCEACTWIRDAQRLTEEFELTLTSNPHQLASAG